MELGLHASSLESEGHAQTRWAAKYSQCHDTAAQLLDDPESSAAARAVHISVVVLIILSTVMAIVETVEDVNKAFGAEFEFLEMTITVCFTLEILARFWTTPARRYCTSLPNLVDVLATMPWYVERWLDYQAHSHVMRTLRMVRLVRTVRLLRVLRFAKAARHSETLTRVFESVGDCVEALFILIVLVAMGAVAAASLVYIVECDSTASHGKFDSIPAALWWALATITTVGYGDAVPGTPLGKIIACFAMVLGLVVNAVAVATMTNAFTESYQKRQSMTKIVKALKKVTPATKKPQGKLTGREAMEDPGAPMLDPSERPHSMHSTPSSKSHQDDLAVTLHLLEKDVDAALLRLAGALHEPDVAAGCGSQSLARLSSKAAPKKEDYAMVHLQMIQDQFRANFKAALALAEHAAEHAALAEQHAAERPPPEGSPL